MKVRAFHMGIMEVQKVFESTVDLVLELELNLHFLLQKKYGKT